jgi:putative transcriptional regulator
VSQVEVGPGTFLIASPTLLDPNFQRTVVLMCEHNERGSMGLVINRRSDVALAEALAGVEIALPPDEHLFLGGPVQRDVLLVLHRTARLVPGAQPVKDGIALGGDMQVLLALLGAGRGGGDRVRVYAGYAGWGVGQLARELESGSWVTCPAAARFVFDVAPSEVWAEVLRSLGPDYARLATVPLDPRVN